MGRNGLEIRPKSVRIRFTYQGKLHVKTLKQNSAPLLPTPANLKYAARVAAEIQQRIKLDAFSMAEFFPDDAPPVAGTVIELIERWMDTLRVQPSTLHGYRNALTFWRRAMPSTMLAKLKHSDILAATASRPDLSGKTLNNYLAVLRQALALAEKDGLISKNPAEGIPAFAHQKPPANPFTRAEADAIVEHFARKHPGAVHNLVEFWIWTGLRTGELAGLKWKNVDLAGARILVKEAIVEKQEKDTTKTNVARWVHLNSRALDAIKRQQAHTKTGRVFMEPRAVAPWYDDQKFCRTYWRPALKALGIKYRRPYNMRHTYATAMLMSGMTPAFCARQLGHAVEVFLNTYARWLDGDQDAREMQMLERNLYPRCTQDSGDELETSAGPTFNWRRGGDSNP